MKNIACLVLILTPLCWGDDWGTLFFNPEQRAKIQAPPASRPAQASELVATESKQQLYNGVLLSPRQKTHWINGQVSSAPARIKPGEFIVVP